MITRRKVNPTYEILNMNPEEMTNIVSGLTLLLQKHMKRDENEELMNKERVKRIKDMTEMVGRCLHDTDYEVGLSILGELKDDYKD